MSTLYTRYHGPTEAKGARISVYAPALRLRRVYEYDHAARDAHDAAIVAWCSDPIVIARLDLEGDTIPARTFVRGPDRDDSGRCYIERDNVDLNVPEIKLAPKAPLATAKAYRRQGSAMR